MSTQKLEEGLLYKIVVGRDERSIKHYIEMSKFEVIQLVGDLQRVDIHYGPALDSEFGPICAQAIIIKKL